MTRPARSAVAALLAAGLLAGTGSATASPSSSSSASGGIDRLRSATVQYFDFDKATEDGFGELKDAAGIACIDSDQGGMGIHYVRGERVADGEVNLLKPEALIYEPQADGYMELVAVEYVVFRSAWRQQHPTGRPSLLGQQFDLVKEGNRYGLPAFFELHVWAWRHNPSGTFQDWNPRVTCEFAPAT